jgi:L,D-peptidoglycan transpeptidase YkuD (ErfK/YbiS/YcfS/YnhG family)
MIVSSFFLFSSCGQCHHQTLLHEFPPSRQSNFPSYLKKRIGHSSQVILVRNMQPHTVSVQVIALERKNDRWRSPFLPMEGVIGRKGFAPPGEKREGDGRTPSGIFPLVQYLAMSLLFPR